jgi:DNA (cytosine-5)-methyltransferase 1
MLAHHYGVPQKRARVFVVGTRTDLKIEEVQKPERVARPTTVREAIHDLPKIRSGLSKGDDARAWRDCVRDSADRIVAVIDHGRHSSIVSLLEKIGGPRSKLGGQEERGGSFVECKGHPKIGGVLNHESRGHIPQDIGRYLFYAAWSAGGDGSPSLADIPESLLPRHENVRRAAKAGTLDKVAFGDRFRVQVADAPSTTVTSHISKDGHYYIHYDPRQCRSLTVREAARLQTFPDDYFFCGPRTEQYKQVGNAVPPMLARQIARAVHLTNAAKPLKDQ